MSVRYLLDTQTFILAAQPGGELPKKAKDAMLKPEHSLYLSMASLWEVQIKLMLEKLRLPVSLVAAVQLAVDHLGLEFLPIYPEHIYKLGELPMHHRDPFDRLLAAQALHERLTLIGGDNVFDKYGVRRIW